MRKTLNGKPIEAALSACMEMLDKHNDTNWEIDKWYSYGSYDYNLIKLYGKSVIHVRRYDLNDVNNVKSKLVIKCELLPGGVIQWTNLDKTKR